ncbi:MULTISPECIES: MnhB domain-containing protein [Mycobacterium]|uniref:MnhA multicomponent sodium ion:proton antiporter n=2 Tax=Mycobacterium intracellulare TaxID=1767 RepID=J9WIL4_MYCIP|nr:MULTISPECIES: MnhB domain-containing protein [Mycobacterium]AFS15993.1 MnhA multicomponent sodium ion:proton antiporter [Mycobacterium intracellulare subsp. intracellulare MTCC 9506]ASW96911.1 sodium:proton antiporter [Mycobacterium intracellulare]MCA2233993.1 MnhB domain-containing protein [Mycobacterium intracellulare]PBA19648.1 sodium:proton antiporter [Mycobacterium intracellulare]WSE52603.1 MnhB domain-containing protein [Mycobacterium sp. 2-64]
MVVPAMTDRRPPREAGWHRAGLGGLLVGGFAAVVAVGFTALPDGSNALPDIARHAMAIALPRWGTTEAVSEVVYGSRAFDTFGETFLLLAAVVAVLLLSRGREPRSEFVGEASAGRAEQEKADPDEGPDRRESQARAAEDQERRDEPEPAPEHADDDALGAPAPERAVAMTVVVRVGARVAAVILAVAGVYLAAWGYTPGGGFPAGVVLAGCVVLLYTALGHRAVRAAVRPATLEVAEMAGAAAIVGVGLVGMWLTGSFLDNWLPLAPQQTIRAGGTLQVISAAELVEVATGITIAVFALLGMGHDWTPDEDES